MGHIEKTVFISYRREDVPWALAVYQNLSAHGYDVFFDYNSIHSGDFEQIIVGNIKARAHFVLILTPSALDRCHEPGDWLRREIEAALIEKRNIIPLFFDGFSFGNPAISAKLTGELAALKKYNGFNVYTDYFDSAMEKLRDQFLNVELEAVLHPLSEKAQREVRAQQQAADQALQQDAPVPVKQKEKAASPMKLVLALGVFVLLAAIAICGILWLYPTIQAWLAPAPTTLPAEGPPSAPVVTGPTEPVATAEGLQVTSGPWTGQAGRLQISVDQVEVIGRAGDRKILRFYLSVNNQTADSITLPLFGNFLAIDEGGQSYEADHQVSNWPRAIPPGEILTGSIDLKDPVPEGVSTMRISFSTIFGALELVGESISVTDIRVP